MFTIEASSQWLRDERAKAPEQQHSNKRPCARAVKYDARRRGRSQRGERIEVNHLFIRHAADGHSERILLPSHQE